jgi:hypothetical protein
MKFDSNALVLIDNANRTEVRRAATDFLDASPFGYRELLDARTPRSGHPTFWNGLIVLQSTDRKAAAAAPPAGEQRAA